MGAPDLQLSCADEIRDAYVQYRRRTHGSYTPSRKQDDAWRRAARLCESLAANPRIFIEAQFATHWPPYGYPNPNQLSSELAVGNLKAFVERFGGKKNPEREVGQQFAYLAQFTARTSLSIDQAALLPDYMNPLRAFFRAIICSDEAFPEVMEVCGSRARAELTANPDIHEFLQTDYEYRTQRILQSTVSGPDVGAHSPPPPASVPGRGREI